MEEQAEKEVVKLPETIDGKKVRHILKSEEKSYALVYLVLALIICLPVFLENAAKEGADASQGAALHLTIRRW